MSKVEIKKDVFWVGAVDWNVRTFHGHTYTTKRGSTYNSYLIIDDKIALVDTVHAPFAAEMMERIREIIPLEKIDYVIANHVETDHSGALPALMKQCPRAKVLGTAKCKEGLSKHYYGDWEFQTVKTKDILKLGRKTIHFIEAPMIHWPDSMFSYLPEEKLLLPNDAFGQHYATSERFDDEVDQAQLMDEAGKYYANILWPLGGLILKKIEDVQKMNIAIDMIAPSHGIIWRKDPGKIIQSYLTWSRNTVKPKVVVVYETMWGATEKMARKIVEGIIDSGAGISAKLYDITQSDRTEVIAEMLDAKGFLFGSSTHDNEMLTTIFGFLQFLRGLKPKNRIAGAFGSYGWAGGAAEAIEQIAKETGIEIFPQRVTAQYTPSQEELRQCYEFGKNFAVQIKNQLAQKT